MAKKALIVKAARKPKFEVRGYTRCQRCGRPHCRLPQVRPVPDLPARDGAPRRAARRHQELLVTTHHRRRQVRVAAEPGRGKPRREKAEHDHDHDRPDRRHADPSAQRQLGVPRHRARCRTASSRRTSPRSSSRRATSPAAKVEDAERRRQDPRRSTLKYGPQPRALHRRHHAGSPSPACASTRSRTSLPKVLGGLGVAIISTSTGLLTDRQAAQARAWAGKSSPTSGNREGEDSHVAHRQAARSRFPSGVDVTIDGQTVTVKGPKGTLSHTVAEPDHRRQGEDGTLEVTRPDDERESRPLHGLTRTLVANMVIGVTDGLQQEARDRRRRLPRHRQGPRPRVRARLQPPGHRRRRPRASPSPSRRPTRFVGRGHRQAAGRRGRRQHPQAAQARPVQGQGRAVRGRASSAARSERLVSSHGDRSQASPSARVGRARPSRARVATSGCARRSPAPPSVRAWSSPAPRGTSSSRSSTTLVGQHAGLGLHAGGRPARAEGDKTAKAKQVGELVAERAKAAGVERGRLRPRRQQVPRPRSRRSPTAPAKPGWSF